MATENNTGDDLSYITSADLSALQYHLVKDDGLGGLVSCTAASDVSVGILQNNPASGRDAQVRPVGISKVVCGAAVAAGDLLTSDSTGRAVTASTHNMVVGQARTAGAGAGTVISCSLRRSQA
jgi:hypothetical protein